MRVTVCFQLKKSKMRTDGVCPLYVRCTMNGQRFEVATGFMVHHDNWNDSKQLIKGRTEDVKIINNRLEKIRTKIQDIFNQFESIGEPFDVLTIKERFLGNRKEKGLLEVFDSVVTNIEARLDKDYSSGTLKHYRTTKKRLFEFIRIRTERSDIALSKVDFSFLNSFDVFLKTEKDLEFEHIIWEHNILSLTQRKTGKPLELPLLPEIGNAIIDYLKHGRPVSRDNYCFLRVHAPYERMDSSNLGSLEVYVACIPHFCRCISAHTGTGKKDGQY